jgi:hypothetical protein
MNASSAPKRDVDMHLVMHSLPRLSSPGITVKDPDPSHALFAYNIKTTRPDFGIGDFLYAPFLSFHTNRCHS